MFTRPIRPTQDSLKKQQKLQLLSENQTYQTIHCLYNILYKHKHPGGLVFCCYCQPYRLVQLTITTEQHLRLQLMTVRHVHNHRLLYSMTQMCSVLDCAAASVQRLETTVTTGDRCIAFRRDLPSMSSARGRHIQTQTNTDRDQHSLYQPLST